MIDEEKQQYQEANATGTSEGGQATSETPANGEAEVQDWELELAKAYQSVEQAQSGATQSATASSSGSSGEPRISEAMEFMKAELERVLEDNNALKAQLQGQTAQLEDLKNQNLRLAADFDNFRRRTQKEKEELDIQARCNTIKALLPVIDNFERARSQIKPQTDSEMALHKSYQSVYKLMVDCLKQIGVSPMRPEGQPFDPNLHEALLSELTDDYEEGTVTQELERGYILGDRVLRHAKVKVAAGPLSVVASDETPPSPEES